MEPLLIRLTKAQRDFIRREKKRLGVSEAGVIRHYIDGYRLPAENIDNYFA